MFTSRKTTRELIEKVENGELSWEQIGRAALDYMSEDDVQDMAISEELIDSPDDTPEDEDDNSGALFTDEEINNFLADTYK
jgi:hypothetical protein